MTYKSAKLAYLLSVCHKYSNKIFTRLIKKHEKSFTVCAKYYFDIEIEMDFESQTNKQSNGQSNFRIKNIYCNFLNRSVSDNRVHRLLEEINTFLPEERAIICSNYMKLISAGVDTDKISKPVQNFDWHLYPLASLINMYSDKYHYLFVPCTLDYSQDVGLVHQCAIIVDLQAGEFLFYEPYGTYIKYDHNYAHPMRKYFEIYADCLPMRFRTDNQNSRIKFRTFHKRHSISEGIQQIILTTNNAATDFEQSRDDLFSDEFKHEFNDLYERIKSRINSDTNPVNQTDKTIAVLTIMEQFEKYTPDEEKKERYGKFWQKALELYYHYNSKTCVSISLVELDRFFSGADLTQFYEKYRSADVKPNVHLMNDLNTLLTELDTDSTNADERVKMTQLCINLS